MVIANIFQTAQTYILSREPLPENLQKIVDAEEKKLEVREALPFEPKTKAEPGKADAKPEVKAAKAVKPTPKQTPKQTPKATKSPKAAKATPSEDSSTQKKA